MRLVPHVLALACMVAALAGLAAGHARAQGLDDTALSKLPLWQPGHAITTSIKDALPVAAGLTGYRAGSALPIPDSWVFGPGYYRGTIRSYCLHAGAYGPTTGDGYLIAPLKGDRAPMIRNILLRSVRFPDIAQEDVQRLIWGVEDGAQWDQFDEPFRARVAPLLTEQEIVLLNVEPKRAEVADEVKRRIGGLIPGAARRAVDQYAELRGKITGITSFEELERIAVKTGAAPWGKDSRRDVQPGPWAYVGEGFFIRAFPDSYPTTTLEVFRVAPATLTRDARGRITRFDSDGYIIDTTYADEAATETVDGKSTSVWPLRSITFVHPDGRKHTVAGKGYVVASGPVEDASVPGGGMRAAGAPGGDLGDLKHYGDGLNTALDPTDKKGQLEWVQEHLNRVDSAYADASGALAGNEGGDAKPKKLDPTKHTATPANTSKQRLALSAFKKKGE